MNDPDIQKLIDGFEKFRTEHFENDQRLYQRLTQLGQSPRVMVIACCDSRVDPAIITGCDPGDLFVVRNVANLVPPCQFDGNYHGTSAAIEFAVRVLKVRHVIVLGHTRCGGVQALVDGIPGEDGIGEFIRPWMEIAESAVAEAGGDEVSRRRTTEQAVIRVSLKNLMTFPWIRERVETGQVALHGWYFDMDKGQLLQCPPDQSQCVPLR